MFHVSVLGEMTECLAASAPNQHLIDRIALVEIHVIPLAKQTGTSRWNLGFVRKCSVHIHMTGFTWLDLTKWGSGYPARTIGAIKIYSGFLSARAALTIAQLIQ